MHDEQHLAGAICLTAGRPVRFEARGAGYEILALDGTIWVTIANDPRDYILAAGAAMRLPGRGSVVIETITPFACIRVTEHVRESRVQGSAAAAPAERIGIEA